MPGALSQRRQGLLRCCIWNIHGYKSRELGNKLKLREVKELFKSHDIIGIVETHSGLSSEIMSEDFKHFSKHREKTGSRYAGGIAIYI